MTRLFTHHNKLGGYVHGILGATALLHFVYRFMFFFMRHGKESMTPTDTTALLLLVHVALHATSFQFALPSRRNFTKPMIWREFRAHNAIFAYRNILGAALGIWAPDWWWRDELSVSAVVAKLCLVLGTNWAADVVTNRLGCRMDRTTNAMPYPKKTDATFELTAKYFYAKSQFSATALAVFGQPTMSFCAVLAIEMASFLMTLTRKGMIQAQTYHLCYGACLFIMGPACLVSQLAADPAHGRVLFRMLATTGFAVRLRMRYRLSKYVTWSASIIFAGWIAAGAVMWAVPDHYHYIGVMGMVWGLLDTLFKLAPLLFKDLVVTFPNHEANDPKAEEVQSQMEEHEKAQHDFADEQVVKTQSQNRSGDELSTSAEGSGSDSDSNTVRGG